MKKQSGQPETELRPSEKPSKTKKILLIVGIILGALALLIAGLAILLHSYLGKINYDSFTVSPLPPQPIGDEVQTVLPPVEASGEEDSSQEEIDAAQLLIEENLKKEREAIRNTGNLANFLLVGSDTRNVGGSGRSDTMILVSINHDEKRISLISLMRDTYVYIPGYYNTRINAAYALGGSQLLIDTIETNFHVEIDNYAAIDFFAFEDAIDALGGVTIEVTWDDLYGMNKKLDYENQIHEAGELHLNGAQALMFARNRSYPQGDFVRTANQRKLISAIFNEAKSAGLSKVDAILDAVLPGITTDMSEMKLLSWVVLAPSMLNYELETYRVPIDGSYEDVTIGGAQMLSVDFDANIRELHRIIYGEDAVQ
ncbi:MAG: LytR family transcriptional regulator [Ruminococcaceae bacterium]|nr:LytR family transcriptional regulator [Oscillospiraceae bacterium]